MHTRRAILEQLRSQLKNATGLNGCWIQRIGPRNAAFPHVTIYADSDSVETLTIHAPNRPQDRVLSVAVAVWVRGTPDDEKAEADLDAATETVEQSLTTPTHADDMSLISTEFEVSEDEPEIHVARLSYRLTYTTVETQPEI